MVLSSSRQLERNAARPSLYARCAIILALIIAGAGLIRQTTKTSISSTTLLEFAPRSLVAGVEEVVNSIGSTTTMGSRTSAAVGSKFQLQQPQAVDPKKYPNFDCAKLLEDLKTDPAVQALDPNLGILYARTHQTNPSFYISLHNKTVDVTRWSIMMDGFYYERALTAAFHEVLQEFPPGTRVLDVGGNIGVFSLVTSSMGPYIIDTFEPNIKNRMRYCESLNLNRWTYTEFDHPALLAQATNKPKNNLYAYGVGQEEGHFLFEENERNPGMGTVINFKTEQTDPRAVPIITLDNFARERGWFETKPVIAIFKVDVEGFEPSVMLGAKELLKSHMIHNIFMEITTVTPAQSEANKPMLNFLALEAGYILYKIGGWSGPAGNPLDWPNDDQLADKIDAASRNEGAQQLNLWWKKPDSTTVPI